jgi:hypothetical protein
MTSTGDVSPQEIEAAEDEAEFALQQFLKNSAVNHAFSLLPILLIAVLVL